MSGLNHVATGALVAVAINRPILALPAAFLSHFVIDALPHYSHGALLLSRPKLYRLVIILDALFSAALLVSLAIILNRSAWLVIGGGILALLPDLMWFSVLKNHKFPKADSKTLLDRLRRFHSKIQIHESPDGVNFSPREICFEVAWFVAVLILILHIGR